MENRSSGRPFTVVFTLNLEPHIMRFNLREWIVGVTLLRSYGGNGPRSSHYSHNPSGSRDPTREIEEGVTPGIETHWSFDERRNTQGPTKDTGFSGTKKKNSVARPVTTEDE